MSIQPVTIDFETYYDDQYSLSKMTAEEYIRDPRFQIIGVSIKHGDGQERWYDNHGNKAVQAIKAVDWSMSAGIAHNMSEFDALILTEKCFVRPRAYQCTMAMARSLHGSETGKSLGALATHYKLEAKGHEVVHAKGKRLEDFSSSELATYGGYCNKDTRICWHLYKAMRTRLPASELFILHLLIRMWAEPRLMVNEGLAQQYLDQIVANKMALLMQAGVTETDLRSDAKFAALLEALDVDPPMKYSPKRKNPDGTPKLVYAFAKTDEAMEELLEDPDDTVATLVAARLGVKTTIKESRVTRLLGIAKRGYLPVPIAYGKTHTNRGAGAQKINMQNMGRNESVTAKTQLGTLLVTENGIEQLRAFRDIEHPDKPGKRFVQVRTASGVHLANKVHAVGLRDLIHVPEGKALIVVDSSNIELRVCHALAGQEDTVAQLRNGEDLYSLFATDLYGRTITKADALERQHGKVAMLQLQYQAGAGSFKRASRIMSGGKLKLSETVCKETVKLYRSKFSKVRQFWYVCEDAIEAMASGKGGYVDHLGLCRIERHRIVLPNGMALNYENLRKEFDIERQQEQWTYWDKEKRYDKKTYGGSVTENLCQALARNVVFEQMVEVEKRWGKYESLGNGVVITAHDEAGVVVDEDDAEECLKFCLDAFKQSPKWWPTLPVSAEGDWGYVYGEVK